MTVTRHFVDVAGAAGTRRVHYRRCGKGPPLLMVHQSPRSSAEYERLMGVWGQWFTCLAPDTPGFGQSAPIGLERPEVEDYADAAVAFMDALGIARAAAYGYHSGAITLVTAAKRHPQRFVALVANGYAVWTAAEKALLGERYTPPLVPAPYGEHLTWLWNRVLEQSWFFPWFDARDAARLPMAHDDPARVNTAVLEMLEAGDEYRLGYSAMLRADRDLPGADAPRVEVAVVASRPDPLAAHLERLGELPPGWSATLYGTPAEAEGAALAHLRRWPARELAGELAEAEDEGFVRVGGGLLHWRGSRGGVVRLHGPGSSASVLSTVVPDLFRDGAALATPGKEQAPSQNKSGTTVIDLPGHGWSDDFALGGDLAAWAEAVADAARALGAAAVAGGGAAGPLARAAAGRLGVAAEVAAEAPGRDALLADAAAFDDAVTPDRFGGHLTRAWARVRAETFFARAEGVSAAGARAFDPAEAAPDALARRHLARVTARGGGALARALAGAI